MTRRVLFLPQNDTHARSVLTLAPELEAAGVVARWLDLDDVFGQGVRALLASLPRVDGGLQAERPFYRLGPIRQVALIGRCRQQVRRWIIGSDEIVAFNDGAVQRVVLGAARRDGLRTDLILDGMITRSTPPRTLGGVIRSGMRRLGRMVEGTGLDVFLPSEVGLSDVDRVFVAGEHSADVLREHGARATTIVASGLPRWSDRQLPPPGRVDSVLYLTGAFAWHGDRATGQSQLGDVEALASVCRRLGIKLQVRVHPRDDRRAYVAADLPVSESQEPLEAAVERADLVLAIVSTGLVEAISLGRLARTFATGAAWQRYASSFAGKPLFAPITSLADLESALAAYRHSVDPTELDRQRAGVREFVAARGKAATRRIVDALASGA